VLPGDPQPEHVLVLGDARTIALAADIDLQQDLKELSVNLTELKLYMLEVWQDTSGLLEKLQTICEETCTTVSPDNNNGAEESATVILGNLDRATKLYKDRLETFSTTWTAEYTAIGRLAVDPFSAELLERHERLRAMLSEFLYHEGKQLSAMRASLQDMTRGDGDGARYHVLHSNLSRAFQRLQLAHHRFEFKAGTIDIAQNFHMDAALQASRGLRRRSQIRIRLIDGRLQEEARHRATKQRVLELADSESRLNKTHRYAKDTVLEMFGMQADLNLTVQQRKRFEPHSFNIAIS